MKEAGDEGYLPMKEKESKSKKNYIPTNESERKRNRMETRQTYFSLDELYISPFSKVRKFDDNGERYYVPIQRQMNPTGIYAADYMLQAFSRGEKSMTAIAEHLGCDGRDLSGLIRCISGMPSEEFRIEYRKRLVQDLLRFTDMQLPEIAAHSGLGTQRNLIFFFHRNYDCTPILLRYKLRKRGDEGRFAI